MAAYCPAGCYCAGQGSECPLFTGNFNNWCGASCSCPQGHYCEFNDFPRPCTLGYYTECPTVSGTPGAKSVEDCLPCPAGTAVNLATPGYAGPENCADCQPGSYSPNEGATSCRPCDAGYYCPNAKMTAKLNCPEGYYCPLSSIAPIKCLESQSCPPNSAAPDVCSPGFVCNSGGSFPCPEGSYCPGGSLFPIICPAGSYCPSQSAEPIPCPEDTFSDKLGLISPFQCEPCPHGFVCPPGSTKYYRTGLTKGELTASILVPILGIIIVLLAGYFCCCRNKKKAKNNELKKRQTYKEEISHPVKSMQPVSITKTRYISSSASSSSTDFPPLPRTVVEAQESFDKTEKEYAQRFAPEHTYSNISGPKDIAISIEAPIVAVSALEHTEEIQMPTDSKWQTSSSSSDSESSSKKVKKKKEIKRKSSSSGSEPSGMKPFSYINPQKTIKRRTLSKHASQRRGVENKAYVSYSSSSEEEREDHEMKSLPASRINFELRTAESKIDKAPITLPVSWVESSSSSSSSTPTTPRAKLEEGNVIADALADITVNTPNIDLEWESPAVVSETHNQASAPDGDIDDNSSKMLIHTAVTTTYSKATTAKPGSTSRSSRSTISKTSSSSSASEENIPSKAASRSSLSSSSSVAPKRARPAKESSFNLGGIRDGIQGIGDAIDRLRRRVRGGKRTDTSDDEDDNKIEENENEKVPTSSSSSSTTLSRPSSCDARKPHNTVPNLQDTPFKMISLQEAAKKAIISPRSQAMLDSIEKNLSDTSDSISGTNADISGDTRTSAILVTSNSSLKDDHNEVIESHDVFVSATSPEKFRNPRNVKNDSETSGETKSSSSLSSSGSSNDSSCDEKIDHFQASKLMENTDKSPPKKMTDALISRWTSQSSISMSDTASEIHRSNDAINDVLKRWSRPNSVSERVEEKNVTKIEEPKTDKIPLDKTNSLNYTANWSVPRRFKYFTGTINSDTTSELDLNDDDDKLTSTMKRYLVQTARSRSTSSVSSSSISLSNFPENPSRVKSIRSSSEDTLVAEKDDVEETNDIQQWEDILAEPALELIRIPKYDPDKVEYVRDIVRKHNHIPSTQSSVRYDKTTTETSSSSSSSSSSEDDNLRKIDMFL